VGIKVDIIDSKEGKFSLKIDSMKRRIDKDQDNELLEILKSFLDKLMINFFDTSKLCIVESKKAFQINIDVFLIDYVNMAYLDIIAIGIRAALEDLELPEVKVLHNTLTNEDELELVEENVVKFSVEDL
jgi:exosome complex RNA-binding protein Rrp42 (RNase PH superfamily)